jgi:serine/threonine protein kinase
LITSNASTHGFPTNPDVAKNQLSTDITTRWYRAPEILHGSQYYDVSIDCWAIGVITAELLRNAPLFNAETDISQLHAIHSLLGTPTVEIWPELTTFSDYNKIQYINVPSKPWKDVLPVDCDDITIDFIASFCCYRSKERMSAEKALKHPFFHTYPLPCHPSQLATLIKVAIVDHSTRMSHLPQSSSLTARTFSSSPYFSNKATFLRSSKSSSLNTHASYDACVDFQAVTKQSISRIQNWNALQSHLGIP